MKLKIYMLTLGLLSLFSCNILRKDKLTLKRLSQNEERQHYGKNHSLSEHSQLKLSDSNHNDFTMMLWPKGKFVFSVANGFEGEAEKIVLLGTQTKVELLEARQQYKQDSTVYKASAIKQKERSSIIEKEKKSLVYTWAWVLILPVLYLIYWFSKRKNRVILPYS